MTKTAFRIDAVSPKIGELTGQGLPRDEFIAAALKLMLEMGFERARFYELADDVVRKVPMVALTHESPEREGDPMQSLLFDFSASSVERLETGLFPAVESAMASGEEIVKEIPDLNLEGRSWVDIPVTAGQDRVGLLACDWLGDADALGGRDLDSLRAVGAQIGSHLRLKPIKAVDQYRKELSEWIARPPRELVFCASEHIARAVDAAAMAVFAFSWTDQRLTKVHDWVNGQQLQRRREEVGELEEDYEVGKYLTGQAWGEDGLRYIVDFRSLEQPDSPFLEPDSLEWHEDLLGEVRSVMYASVGALDRRYLIRFMNRLRRPKLPFLGETALLDALVGELRSEVDAAVANQRSESLQEIARLASQASGPRDVAASVVDALAAESVEHFGVLCHQEEATQFGFTAFKGPLFADFSFDLSQEWEQDELYVEASERDGVFRLSHFSGRSALAEAIEKLEYKAIQSFAIRTGQTRGAFFVPIASVPSRRSGNKMPPDCGFGTVSLLHAYSRLIGNAVETRNSQSRVDGARRALGLIGHELRGPLATANSEAELAINVARRVLRDIYGFDFHSQELYRRLLRHMNAMWDRQRQVSVALELAPLVAQESEGELQLHFKPQDLYSLLRDAVQLVEAELRMDEERRNYRFEYMPSTRKLGPVVCDPDFIRHVFKNVLRNAVKYSISPGNNEPMIVTLIGEPQSHHVGVKVRNWGLGVPEEQLDLIFHPWVRGGVEDEVKAIRGMGLGLFLARRILAAHDGAIMFTSQPTLDDPEKLKKLEGYETELEIRIPRSLSPGTRTFRWKDRPSTYTAE